MVRELFPRRTEILRAVIDVADERRDGHLPMAVEGVSATFGDELTLLAALQLRWHTHLAARIEQELAEHPRDRENAVVVAWLETAEDMPGVRMILDEQHAHPPSVWTGEAMGRAISKEHEMLALMSGRAEAPGDEAAGLGRTIELAARASYVPQPVGAPTPTDSTAAVSRQAMPTQAMPTPAMPTPTLMQRLRAAWAA